MVVSGQSHAPTALCPGKRTPGTHCTAGWVGPRAGLDTEVRGKILSPLPGIEPRSPGRPVVRHYTDWATPAPNTTLYIMKYLTQHRQNTHHVTCRPICESCPELGPASAPCQGLPAPWSSKCPLLKMASQMSANCYTVFLPSVPFPRYKLTI
jgi:hypothetical protein